MNPAQLADHVLSNHWDQVTPVKLNKLATAFGARIVQRGGQLDGAFDIKGRMFWSSLCPLLEVNCNEHPYTKRVITAHLLGHYLLEHYNCRHETAASFEAEGVCGQDRDANLFAATLLLPEEAVRKAHAQGWTLEVLADMFEVPMSAMSERLASLNLWL